MATLALTASLVLGACASDDDAAAPVGTAAATPTSATPQPDVTPSPRVIEIGPEDQGDTVDLHVGDVVRILTLARDGQAWSVRSYPRTVIELDGSTEGKRFEFRAVAGGTGVIRMLLPCPPPLPGAEGDSCPGGGANDDSSDERGRPEFWLRVRVS